jgi:hypothetical protein
VHRWRPSSSSRCANDSQSSQPAAEGISFASAKSYPPEAFRLRHISSNSRNISV